MAFTDAERAKRYRERNKARKENLKLDPDLGRKKIESAHSSYLSSEGLVGVDKYQESSSCIYYLIKKKDRNVFFIVKREIDLKTLKTKMTPRKPIPLNKIESNREFEEIKKNTCPRWITIDHCLDQAIEFHVRYKYKLNFTKHRYPVKRLSFLLALDEVLANGYEVNVDGTVYNHKAIKNQGKSARKCDKGIRRQIVNIMGNPVVPDFSDSEEWSSFIKEICEKLIQVAPGGKIALKTFKAKCSIIRSLVSSFAKMPGVFGSNTAELFFSTDNIFKEVKSSYLNSEEAGTPSIAKKKSYQKIELKKLERMLEYQWIHDPNIFYVTLLGLSTLLRPSELERLIKNPEEHITEKYYLDYKSERLITKTKDKTDMEKINNPQIEIVAWIILKNFKLTFNERNYKKGHYSSFRLNKEFEDCFIRRLRTTGAVYLKYTSTDNDAQTRLGHTTSAMLHNTYAPLLPSTKNIEYFFSMKKNDFFISLDGVETLVSKESSLWDLWLLKNFMKHYLSGIKSEDEKNKFKRLCLDAAQTYDRVKGGEENSIQKVIF